MLTAINLKRQVSKPESEYQYLEVDDPTPAYRAYALLCLPPPSAMYETSQLAALKDMHSGRTVEGGYQRSVSTSFCVTMMMYVM